MNQKKTPLQIVSSFTDITSSSSSPASPSMCFTSPKRNEKRDLRSGLCGCQRAPKSHCISAFGTMIKVITYGRNKNGYSVASPWLQTEVLKPGVSVEDFLNLDATLSLSEEKIFRRCYPFNLEKGVLVLVIAYTAMGSILFVSLEGETEESSVETAVAASKPYPRTDTINPDIRSRTVDRLWSITEDLNILYKENWTRLAAQEVQHFQDTLLRAVRASKIQQPGAQPIISSHKWSYASAFLYSLTLITTIGYGGVSPRTQWGRIAALLYALLGIPIVLLYLSAMGEGLSAAMRCLFRKASRSRGGKGNNKTASDGTSSNSSNSSGHHMHHHLHAKKLQNSYQMGGSPSVPISICIMILICYIALGAVLFHKIQSWSVLESLYFCFTSLGTIGFGDLAPSGNLSQYLASGYILIGMAVVAMCFSLIQTELILWLRKFGVQDQLLSANDDVALVSVAVTPKS